MSKTQNAFAIIHFGSNPKYFELELYFCSMLKDYTENNNGVFIFFHNLSDDVYDQIDSYVNKIYKMHKKSSSTIPFVSLTSSVEHLFQK